jgi:nitroreductase
MDYEEMYQAIFKRKSVRKYDSKPLDASTLMEIQSFVGTLEPMLSGIRTEVKFGESDALKGFFKMNAPHFLAIFSENKDGYLANAGFLMQQVDLFLSARGIGSCWQGGLRPASREWKESELEYVISLALGQTSEKFHRESAKEFKRKALADITDISGFAAQMEAVRLAPSATNNQAWFFTDLARNGTIDALCENSLTLSNMNRINIGIAFCHLWLASLHKGKRASFTVDHDKEKIAQRGYSYVASAKVT